ncbi:MAG: hypothetical protein HKM93_16050 [Desulfobacteraceae bacterium]|nr:hypothetical protein [Desulfobacteraceae bacterium]
MKKRDTFKPAVTKNVLLFMAGFVWCCVGSMLLAVTHSWLTVLPKSLAFLCLGAGIVLALVVHHFGFLRIVDRNVQRILPMTDKKCLFSFITWKSYLLILVMIAIGSIFRHSAIPKSYLAVLYLGIGLALILSSFRYLRVFMTGEEL